VLFCRRMEESNEMGDDTREVLDRLRREEAGLQSTLRGFSQMLLTPGRAAAGALMS